MKKFLPLICVLFIGCSKKSDNVKSNQPPNMVTIGGQLYSTVVIGSQTWTSVNYDGSGGITYTNSADNGIYGKYYTAAELTAISPPAGWRLPTLNDFDNLYVAIGASKLPSGAYAFPINASLELMSVSGWTAHNGTNDLGFNAQPAGMVNMSGFIGQGTEAIFWSSTMGNHFLPMSLEVTPTSVEAADFFLINSTDRASVRFVKDN